MNKESFQDVCRLCLSKEGLMLPIFRNHESTDGVAFSLKIMSCAAIEVFADDGLPSKICHVCVHQVEKSFQFKTMCENSDAFLRSRSKPADDVENDDDGEPDQGKEEAGSKDKENGDFSFSEIPRCSSCSQVFSSYDELTDHASEKHLDDPDGFVCAACKVPTSCLLGFKTHVNLFHRFKCDRCDRVFKHRKNLRDHTAIHFKESRDCRFCKKNFQNLFQLKKHELDHAICKFCGQEMDSEEAHSKICVSSYACKFCNCDFQFKKDLIAHVNEVHDDESCVAKKKCVRCRSDSLEEDAEDSLCRNCKTESSKEEASFVCKFCTKSFSLKSSLRRHEKSHSGVKPYQCKFCPRKFKDNSTCIVHTRTHTGEHPFRCRECNKDFKQLANLKMHTYRHHKRASEKETLYRNDRPASPDPGLEQSLHLFVSSGE